MSIVQDVAEWVHTRVEGALCGDVATEFAITAIKGNGPSALSWTRASQVGRIRMAPTINPRIDFGNNQRDLIHKGTASSQNAAAGR